MQSTSLRIEMRGAAPMATTIAIVSMSGDAPLSRVATDLAAAFGALGPALHVSSARYESVMGEGAARGESAEVEARAAAWLDEQESRYRYIIYEADATPSAWTRRCIGRARRVVLVAPAESEPAPGDIERVMPRATGAAIAAQWDLVLWHGDGSRPPRGTSRWLAAHPFGAHHHLRAGSSADAQRLARHLAGRSVGLVLGGGAARAFAHLGALRALREAAMPIDLIGGTSAGAVIAAQYAMGWDLEMMMAHNRELALRTRPLLSRAAPLMALSRARAFTDALLTMCGQQQIEDLWVPYFSVSSNLTRADVMVHQQGSLWRYLRASCAMPGILPPLLDNGELLADGAVLNNMPIGVMRDLCGDGLVIAVDVSVQVNATRAYQFDASVSPCRLLLNRLTPFAAAQLRAPSLKTVLLRSMELASVRNRLAGIASADLYIDPPVSQFGLFDTRSFDRIVQAGYESAVATIARWRQDQAEQAA